MPEETMSGFLKRNYRSAAPAWLSGYRPERGIDFDAVRNTPCVYYPGAGNDGQPIHTFAAAHAAFLYFYVDYLLSRREVEEQLSRTPFRGYRRIGVIDMQPADLTPRSWRPHVRPSRAELEAMQRHLRELEPYGFLAVFEREAELTDDYGAERFAVIFLCGDGIATYDAVFGGGNMVPPFAAVLQDHGWGCNYSCFGRGGLLERIAVASGVFPRLLLAGKNTDVWAGYAPLPAPGVLGGMHRNERNLFICEQ